MSIPKHEEVLAKLGRGIHRISHCGELFFFAAPSRESAVRRFLKWCEENSDPTEESEIDSIEMEPFDQEFTLHFEGEDVRTLSMYPYEWVALVDSLGGSGPLASTVY